MCTLLYLCEVIPTKFTRYSHFPKLFASHQNDPSATFRRERREGSAIPDTPRHRTEGMAMHFPSHNISTTLLRLLSESLFPILPPYFAFYPPFCPLHTCTHDHFATLLSFSLIPSFSIADFATCTGCSRENVSNKNNIE